jgi:hypothetical protein
VITGVSESVDAHARIAKERRTVRGVNVRLAAPIGPAELLDRAQRVLEPRALLAKERRARIVGRREMRVDGFELEVLAREQLGQRAAQVVVAKTEPIHPGVDFQMVADAFAVARRGRLDGACRRRCRDGRGEPTVEQAIEIADAQRAEDENRRPDARGPEGSAFFDVSAGQKVRAGVLERARDLGGAMSVRIRLDDGDDPRNTGSGPRFPKLVDDRAVVRFQRGQIDARDSGTNHRGDHTVGEFVNW